MEGEAKERSLKLLRLKFFVINLIYLIIACLVVSKIKTLETWFGQWYNFFWYTHFDVMAYLWVAGGWALLPLSIVGIILIITDNAALHYTYAAILSFLSIYQIGAGFASFSFITQCGGMAWNRILVKIIRDSDYKENRDFLNFIQSTLKCCGIVGPFDFLDGRFQPWVWDRYTAQLPQSCYVEECNDIGYCGPYYARGCYPELKGVLLTNVVQTGLSSLVIGFLEILGVICAIMVANEMKGKITDRSYLQSNINEKATYGSTDTYESIDTYGSTDTYESIDTYESNDTCRSTASYEKGAL